MNKVHQDKGALPFVITMQTPQAGSTSGKSPALLRSGDLCPTCKLERLEYDSLLNLACPGCGYALGGCFT